MTIGASQEAKGSLTLVGTPIGNRADLSSRGLDALRQADTVLAEDTRVSGKLLTSLGVEARLSLDPLEVWVDIADHYRSDYATSEMNGHKLISTAGATYKFCKNKCRLSLYIDDIFNKDLFYNTKYSAFQRFESTENYIHHYARLTFTYRFDAKANKKK